ncbi:hypothetical protein LJY25_12940 [Hymenobacter sp. BT175]|nr:hypothetical protein [Hymenobacter translucens]
MPAVLTENDKLIIVDGAALSDVSAALARFSSLYNESGVVVRTRLVELSQSRFALVFPYDITFDRLCYLVNYLTYPEGIDWPAKIYGWATIRPADEWFRVVEAGKKAILFVPEDDQDHDNVFLTTEDNRGYKLDFSQDQAQPLSAPKERFAEAPLVAGSLQQAEGKTIQ